MPTYISLIEYTATGIEHIEEGPERLDRAKELAESFGGEILDFYLTFGRYDGVLVSEFPDDEAFAAYALKVASEGAVSTETLKAFPEAEYRDIIGGLHPAEAGPPGEMDPTD